MKNIDVFYINNKLIKLTVIKNINKKKAIISFKILLLLFSEVLNHSQRTYKYYNFQQFSNQYVHYKQRICLLNPY